MLSRMQFEKSKGWLRTGILVKGWRIIVCVRRMEKEGIGKILFKNYVYTQRMSEKSLTIIFVTSSRYDDVKTPCMRVF